MPIELLYVGLLVCALNIPFGYWRANAEKRTVEWFVAIHMPVPFVVALRLLFGVPLSFSTLPFLMSMFFLGQYTGGTIYKWRANRTETRVSSCLVWDIVCTIRNR